MKNSGRTIVIAVALLLISFPLSAQMPEATEITNIRFQRAGEQAEFIIDCTKPVSHESFTLLNPNRLVVDLTKIEKISMNTQLAVEAAGVEKIIVGQYKADTARLVFHFSGPVLSHRIEDMDSGLKVVIMAPPPPPEEPEVTEIKPVEVKPSARVARTNEPIVEPRQPPAAQDRELKDMSIGVGVGFYFLQEALFQDIYGDNVMNFRGELAFRLPISVDSFDIWSSFSSFSAEGQSTLFEENLKLSMTTFSFAIRYLKKFGRFVPFVGLGVDYTSYRETYPEDFAIPSVGGNDLGYHGQLGTYFHFIDSLSAKVHLKYNMAETIENALTINLGGIEYGLSLVWHFNL